MAISLYKIKLNINPKEDSYRGTVKIYSSTKEIVLDCEVEVREVYYLNRSIPFSLEKNKLTIKLEPSTNTESKSDSKNESVSKSDLKNESDSKNESEEVRIDFIGKIRDSLLGLYRSNDTLVTHFEPNDARKLFPCQDTPKVKSIFQMEVSVPKEYIVLFNTSVLSKKEYDDKTEYSFKVTPLMSTYLLALSIGKYDALEIIDNKFKIIKYEELLKENISNSDSLSNNEIISDLSEENLISFSKSLENNETKLRIYTERNLAHTAKLSLFLTDQLIKNLSSLFNYNFMLDKLDQLSLKKFGMGAMENFGLITYRESLLLFDKKSSVFFMAYIAETVAHELVHQWFGNLVTPSSWEDLWLNEGFATFLSNYVLDEYEYFIPKEVLQSFNEENDKLGDKLIESDEIKTEKLNYNFMADFISHSETGLFLDSLSSHPIISSSNANELFDEITYQKASSVIKMLFTDKIPLLKSYINKFAYKSVKSKHILTHLNLQMIYDWLYKKHYPLLKIKLEKTNLVIEQEVFTLLPTKEETTWFVPIEILIKNERKIFEMKEKKLVLELKNEFMNFCENQIEFLKITNGFFRVWYQDPLFYSELDIFKVNDLYSLLLRGDILLKDYLEIVKKNDFEEYHLFESVTSQLMSLMKKIGLSDEYLLRILNKEIEPKKEGLNPIMAMKREALRLKLLTLLGKQPVIPEKPHFRTPKFIKMSKEGKESDLFTLYKSTKIPDERSASIFSLFTTNNLEKLKEYFNKLINKEISLSDSIYIFNGLANNLKLRLEIFDLILQTDLEKLFGDDKNLLGDCLESLFSNVPDEYVDKVSKYVMVDGIEFKRNVILEMMEVDRNVRRRVSKN